MAERIIQSSFNVGEISPACYARTDLAKYHSAAALLRNFFVDYRGGASTRPGFQYICQAYKSGTAVRLIPFEASITVAYVLEFGDYYVRFINNRQPVLEAAISVTSVGVDGSGNLQLGLPGAPYAIGDWVQLNGLTASVLNGGYYIVSAVAGSLYSFTYLPGAPVPAQPGLVPSGTAARVYTLPSPYAAADLALLKFAQSVNSMVICHPGYAPYVLKLTTATNWNLSPIAFGTQAMVPTGLATQTSLSSGSCTYSYVVTSVDQNGEESGQSATVTLSDVQDIRVVNGTIRVTWVPVPGATKYNIYKCDIAYFATTSPGAVFGYLGQAQGNSFDDSNIAPNFDNTPPILRNIINGAGVDFISIGSQGSYNAVPAVILTDVGATPAVTPAQAVATLALMTPGMNTPGQNYKPGDTVQFPNGFIIQVTGTTNSGSVLFYNTVAVGNVATSGSVPTGQQYATYNGPNGSGLSFYYAWGLSKVNVVVPGLGYSAAPTVSFTAAATITAGTAVATLQPAAYGNPSVPGFFQQRLFLGGPAQSPAGFNFSQPGNYYNFNISDPSQADDSISGTLVSSQLQSIKAVVPASSGLILFTDHSSWLINGGGNGSAISPSAIVANEQSHNGSSDLPPIVANYDILYVQAKGSVVRDSTYNIYANVYTGADITALSSHLFYGYQLKEWAFAEEPFKVIWSVRNDGQLLSLTFLKEQEFIGWAHSDTTNGLFKSIATVTEVAGPSTVDAIYTVVQRVINGNTVQYIERLSERLYTTASDATCVDAYLRYVGGATTSFAGAMHLAGQLVTGLADGKVIAPFVMPASGAFVLPVAASVVTIGIGYTCQLKTLAIDIGEPTVQGKQKKISNVNLRLEQVLGLKIGVSFGSLVVMKDTTVGVVGRMSDGVLTDLYTGDASTYLDPSYNTYGQYCVQQDQPFPATILGVIPEFTLGDTDGKR